MRLEISLDPAVLDRLDNQTAILYSIENKVERLMATVDQFITDMTAKMDAEDTAVAALKPFIVGLFAQIKAAVPALTPAQMTALDAIEARVDAEKASIAAAIVP